MRLGLAPPREGGALAIYAKAKTLLQVMPGRVTRE
jgi:hypothetical protein